MIVGIGCNYQVGKDTAAQALGRELGYRRVGFADKLKELALAADPIVTRETVAVNLSAGRGRLKWVVQGLGWDEAKCTHVEVREFLQRLGVGAREVFGWDFWVDQAVAGVKPGDRVVIPDVRFVNEAEKVKELDGFLIKVERPGQRNNGHVSERDLDDFEGWDAVIVNDGTIPEFEQKVVRVVRDELARRENDDD